MTLNPKENVPSASAGKVYLVGAGPGDPGLITLRGIECLALADLILYDYLVNPDILDHARQTCELICLGRHGTGRMLKQEEINQRLVADAQSGKLVVRLKSGDPGVFARLAEETSFLDEHGVAWEVVPGITAAMAAGSYAGVPTTHRDHASAVAFVTGQENSDKDETLDYGALAEFPGTLVIYMAVTTAPRWVAALIEAGKDPATPVAIVRRCSFTDQRTIRCLLSEVPERLTPYKKFPPPAIAIVGSVAGIEVTKTWFEQRRLFGTSVLITRPHGQAVPFRNQLRELGADVTVQTAIEIGPPDDWSAVDEAIRRLPDYDWLVFSSVNGVRFFMNRLLETGHDVRRLGDIKLAAIGERTTASLAEYQLRADLQPEEYRAEALAESLAKDASGRKFLLARASRGREVLAEELTSAGGEVEQIVVYNSRDVKQVDAAILQRMKQGGFDWTTVTSSAIARSLVKHFGQALTQTKLVSISPITSATLRELGCDVAAEATEYTATGVIDAIVASLGASPGASPGG